MTLTLLVDLDNTLLGNDIETFIPAYLRAMGEHLGAYVTPERLMAAMLQATQCMFDNTNPKSTLKASFDPCFYPQLGWVEAEMRGHFDQFYAEVFPTLRALTRPRPEAVDFVEAALERGYRISIATNPAFPRTAILQRLEWAGLPPTDYPFKLIPSYETFHFVKPNPAFFAEFLGRLGWPDGPVLMVGDNPDHDIRGSQEMGIPVFWIPDGQKPFPVGELLPNGSGTLSEVLPWIDSLPEGALTPDFTSPSAMVAVLRASPAALSGLLLDIPAVDWPRRPKDEEWSLTEIVCHLRDVEIEVNLPRLQKIIREDDPFIPGVDSDVWADERGYIHQDGLQALADFTDARLETLEIMDRMDESGWSRPVRHAIFGPTDLREVVRIMAGHERLHGRQIYRSLPK